MMDLRVSDGAIVATPCDDGRIRIVVLRSDDPQHSYLEARATRELELLGVVIEPGARQRARLWRRRQWSAWAWRVYQSARQRLTGRAAYRRRYFASAVAASATSAGHAAEHLMVDWINSAEVSQFLDRLRPDLLVVCGTGYIRREIFARAPLAINVHGGFLPYYKGNHGIFFAFEKADFDHIAASLHLVSARLDAGPLIAVIRPEVFPHDNDEHLYCRAVESAVDRFCELIRRLESGERVAVREQPTLGITYRHRDRTPARELRLWARRRLGAHLTPRVRLSEPPEAEHTQGHVPGRQPNETATQVHPPA